MENNIAGVVLVDLTKCTDEEKGNLTWLAVAQVLDGKRCAVCGHLYNSRESVKAHSPKWGYGNDIVGGECWDKYKKHH